MSDPSLARRLILILGGARSGKSRYAEELAPQLAGEGPVLYVATATPLDDEMRARIAQHQAARPAHWLTLEAPRDPAEAVRASLATNSEARVARVILLDCLTLLAANLLTDDGAQAGGDESSHTFDQFGMAETAAAEARVMRALDDLLAVYREGAASLIVVSNEVGMGIVPAYPSGRAYRDILGRANARLAAEADAALLMVAGLPIELKALAEAWRGQVFGW
ncbi:MAG TPA: bifunctional adenosylcobinamide kinase/adenosylcobinamide-phosphate guanylyltransferase [Ktedonobacterales bacterium]|nr:bifunctional adenosylcobinamide kinase/adenosylcobinamide-phosphate guanylyltransferase [Ktedonobacterales bacterium]